MVKVTEQNKKKLIEDYVLIVLGCTLVAISVQKFLAEGNLVIGGLAGIAVILKYFTGISIATTNLLVNGPLFLLWIKQRGIKATIRIVITVVYLSFALWYVEFLPSMLPKNNLFLASIYGALTLGGGIGLILRASSSSGGTDLAANLLHFRFKSIPISVFMQTLDSTIIVIGAVVFGKEKAMYALISAFIVSRVAGYILEGGHSAKAVLVISEKIDEIAPKLQDSMKRGGTFVNGTGMYTNNEKKMLYMVVSSKQIFKFQKLVNKLDSNAFITITDVKEVYGNGFKQLV